jgi:hypothetical protein
MPLKIHDTNCGEQTPSNAVAKHRVCPFALRFCKAGECMAWRQIRDPYTGRATNRGRCHLIQPRNP